MLSVILSDMDSDLLKQGQPTNIWSNASPTYDLEYADDTLLLALTTDQLHAFRTRLEHIAAEYGMTLNHQKTELLPHPKLAHSSLRFKDGSPVQSTPQVKYLGSLISWEKPFEQAFYHRLDLAEEAFEKSRLVSNSSKSRKSTVHILQATFVPTLTDGLDPLTLTEKHLKRIDGQFYRFLRRAIGIKASYYSRITNLDVWIQAGRPHLPSDTLRYRQYQITVDIFQADRDNP